MKKLIFTITITALKLTICQGCQGSILGYHFKNKALLIFSNPANSQKRKNLVVRTSEDGGKTWQKDLSIYKGPAAYSCLSRLSNGNVGLLFEEVDYKKIGFVTIPRKLLF